jgi:hypothetical protein
MAGVPVTEIHERTAREKEREEQDYRISIPYSGRFREDSSQTGVKCRM